MSKNIGFIGAGSMAEGIIKGLLAAGSATPNQIFINEILPQRATYIKETYGVVVTQTYEELAKAVELIVFAVRPQDAKDAAEKLRGLLGQSHVLVSICAGIHIEQLVSWIGEEPGYARVMPNILIEAKKGYSALAFRENVEDAKQKEVQKITDAIGDTLVISEEQFDAFTALSCAGPEWILLFASALIDAGVESGLSRINARKIVTQNLIGTGTILTDPAKHPFQIIDGMNTPGGISIAGYHSFSKAGFIGIVMDGVKAAYERTQELGK